MQKKNNSYRSGFVAILGRPNVGKSTLMNALVGEKVAITSSRAQTTRNRIMGVMTRENLQILFLDTPGLHAPRNKLGEYMMGTVQDALDGIDAVILMLDATDVRNADMEILEKYGSLPVKRALVVNKIDQVNSDTLAPLLERLSTQPMDAFVPISALKKNGLDRLVGQLASWMPQGPQYFPDDMVTDQPERQVCAEIIREKLLLCLDKEIPHGTAVELIRFAERERDGVIEIDATIYCEKDSHKGIIIGKGGAMLKKISTLARQDIERFMGAKVYLQTWVKVKENWRDNLNLIHDFGYKDE